MHHDFSFWWEKKSNCYIYFFRNDIEDLESTFVRLGLDENGRIRESEGSASAANPHTKGRGIRLEKINQNGGLASSRDVSVIYNLIFLINLYLYVINIKVLIFLFLKLYRKICQYIWIINVRIYSIKKKEKNSKTNFSPFF